MTRAESIEELYKLIPDCEKCPLIVANCKKQGNYNDCMKQREAIKTAIEALSIDIVRCKDCVHGQQSVVRDKAIWCDIYEQYLVGEEFCSRGCLPEIMTPPQGEQNEKEK